MSAQKEMILDCNKSKLNLYAYVTKKIWMTCKYYEYFFQNFWYSKVNIASTIATIEEFAVNTLYTKGVRKVSLTDISSKPVECWI